MAHPRPAMDNNGIMETSHLQSKFNVFIESIQGVIVLLAP